MSPAVHRNAGGIADLATQPAALALAMDAAAHAKLHGCGECGGRCDAKAIVQTISDELGLRARVLCSLCRHLAFAGAA